MNKENSSESTLIPWEPYRLVRKVDPIEARFSRGFLRCRPERWFPGFAAEWLPLAHSLGVEIRVVEVRPVVAFPKSLRVGFTGLVDDEPMVIFVDDESLDVILDTVSPGIASSASSVVAEYLARRLFTSLARSWSGPDSSVVHFDASKDPHDVTVGGAVKFTFELNGSGASIWLCIGKTLVERLDGLWRRQLRSSSRSSQAAVTTELEIAQLAVPPSVLGDYVRVGSSVDLEVLPTDMLTLRVQGKAWLPARLVAVAGNIGFEVISGAAANLALPADTTRLSINFGSVTIESSLIPEVTQVGAIFETGIKLEDTVDLSINNEVVARARLCMYEGRLAISVI